MSVADLWALAPLIVLAAAVVIVMLVAGFVRHHGVVVLTTQAGLLLTTGAFGLAAHHIPRTVTPLLVMDAYALFFIGLVVLASFAVAALAYDYFERRVSAPGEFYILLLVASLGGAVLVASRHFAALFLGLELLSVALFGLIAYPRTAYRALEAGIKYLVLSGVASSFLLFGMALVYGSTGTLVFAEIGRALSVGAAHDPAVLAGAALIIAGLGFKLSLVPFHMWVADVYEGAPAPVAAYLATVSKGAVFALLVRYFVETGAYRAEAMVIGAGTVAVASMLAGNLLALLQDNIKRVLAYSSIAHMGYLMVALLAGGGVALEAVGYYLAAYFVTMLGAFGVITLMSLSDHGEADHVSDYRGLFWRRPVLAGVFTAMLLSLAGIPVTMGFVAKFYVVAAGVEGALWLLIYVLIAGSIIGLYYYLRIILAMYRATGAEAGSYPHAVGGGLVVLVTTVLLVGLGIYPAPLIAMLQQTTSTLG